MWPGSQRSSLAARNSANFASGVGPCSGIVEPFKHFLRVTAHSQILVLELELRAPMGACSGQYGNDVVVALGNIATHSTLGSYSGTSLNGHPSIADTYNIIDNSDSPDCPSILFNT